ncbi:glycosyltransferase family 1 protein [Thermococcus sp. LS1]|uniref:glycosyltransferase family 4 protein n=1 Tax=Thermococcus sp. LS1 TaxID=1638259 RepID=UPI00143C76CD|nr:glycosyltransferase family 4 protein [Thermococcus sp. LS1]NJD99672.1 glycosyltransferase family 1 protein [Thermococcus sp. LS1]
MESLKIALVSDWFFPSVGGIEYHIHDLATQLTYLGHDVHVITRSGTYPDENLPYEVHRFKGRITMDGSHVSIGTDMLKKVNELYKQEHFDITHGHSIYSPMAVGVANLSAGIRCVPSIVTGHSLLGDSILNPVYIMLLRFSLRKVSSFIAVSNAVEKDMRSILGKSLRNREIYLIPNGIDTDFWKLPEDKEELKEAIGLRGVVITTTSRLTKRKRIHVIPKIAKRIKEEYGGDVTFMIIGDGPERSHIERLVREYGVGDIVKLLGRQPREKVREYLQASDVYLSPTVYEAFGIAALEALACGVPVVANNHGGISEIVEHGRTGLVSHNDHELVQNLMSLIANEERRQEMSKNARKSVKNRFNWETLVLQVLNAYERTMEQADEEPFALYKLHQMLKREIANAGVFNL